MKVFITLTLFLIDVIFETFGYNAEPPAFNVYVHVKPKCLSSKEEVYATVYTLEYPPHHIDVTCNGYYSNLGPYVMRKVDIPGTTLTFDHKESDQKERRKYNVSKDCELNLFQRSVFFYTYSIYNFFCDESKLK
uniref:ZP domain-containing protein n=1 Tax=Strongyloides venezuelensis TaxID=75913 RepID=A0A0K0FGI9_STRVS